MKVKFYPLIRGTALVVFLLSTGIFIHTEVTLKQFDESLPKVPIIEQQEVSRLQAHQPTETSVSEGPSEPENVETDAAKISTSKWNEPPLWYEDEAFKEKPQSEPTVPDPFGGWPAEVRENGETGLFEEQEIPYDIAKVKAGFEAYNVYLAIDPPYAYYCLDEAFREQFGDSSDVDILVETIRRSNNGTATIDDAIASAEASLRLMSADGISPPEAIASVADEIENLRAAKQLAREQGTAHLFRMNQQIGGEN